MKKGLLKFIILFTFIFAVFPNKVSALTFKVEKSADTVKPNSELTVYIKATDVDASNSIKGYNISLAYDSSKLQYKSSSSNIAKINPLNPIVIENDKGTISNDTTIATIVFGVKSDAKAGDANLTISSSDCITLNDTKISATNTSSMVKVTSFSNDASLSSLKIPNATLSPKFDKNVLEYSTEIKDITELTVNAVPTDSNAKIMISDNYKNLVKGENQIKIVVTAEDGATTKTYIVKVVLSLTPTEEEVLKANANLKNLEVEKFELDFTKELKKYTLTVPYETKKISLIAEAENPNATIEMEGTTNLKVGRNTIKVVVTSEDLQNKETYVVVVTRQEEEKEVIQTCPDETSTREWILFSICMFVTFTLGIVLGYYMCKKEVLNKIFKKKKKSKEEEKLSDTIKLEPVNENKDIKKDKKENQ